MARALRFEYSGALYHVTLRGGRRENIYEGNIDRERLLNLCDDVCRFYNWDWHAYRRMSNHCYLLIETPDANLTNGMRQLNGVYSQKVIKCHKKDDH